RLLSGIPVRISPGAIEKISDTSGNFKILAPANGPLNVTVNAPRPAAPNSPNTHFFDPSHAATTVNNLSANTAPWNMSNPGATNVLTPPLDITLDSLSATTNSGGNASISGALKSAENTTVPLPGLMVGLREGQGRLIQVVQSTGAAGAYTFSNLPAGEFYVLPVLPRNQAAVPMQIPVSLIWGQSLGVPAFLISGVPATIQVNAGKPGVFVLVAQTGALPGGGTPPIYDARAPGQAYYTKVSGDNGIATLLVPPGQSYALKCWKPNPQGGYDYISSPPTGPVPGGTLNALQI